jgi:hypothetical protein
MSQDWKHYTHGKIKIQLTICATPEEEAAAAAKAAEEAAKKAAEGHFSQEQVNKFLADEKRKWQSQQQKTITELTEIKNRLTTSDEEKQQLTSKITEMETQLLSKEEIAEREKKKLEAESKTKIDALTTERDGFKNQYANYRVENEITLEAVKQEAFSPKQVVALLRGDTRLIPAVGEDKKPTGELIPMVVVKTVKEGKPITLELSIFDAVKRMKETPDEYGNLFKSTMAGGVGGTNVGSGGSGGLDPESMKDPASYRKNREKLGIVKQT